MGRSRRSEEAAKMAKLAGLQGDWRRCAAYYRIAYQEAPKNLPLGFSCICGFASALRKCNEGPEEADLTFMESVLSDSSPAPRLHRVYVHGARAATRQAAGDLEGAAEDYWSAIELAASPADTERATMVTVPNTTVGGCRHSSAGSLFDTASKDAQAALAALKAVLHTSDADFSSRFGAPTPSSLKRPYQQKCCRETFPYRFEEVDSVCAQSQYSGGPWPWPKTWREQPQPTVVNGSIFVQRWSLAHERLRKYQADFSPPLPPSLQEAALMRMRSS